MVGTPGMSHQDCLKQLHGGPAYLQGMLHRNTTIHLWIRRSWRSISEAPFGWGARHGVGYVCGRGYGEHRSSL